MDFIFALWQRIVDGTYPLHHPQCDQTCDRCRFELKIV